MSSVFTMEKCKLSNRLISILGEGLFFTSLLKSPYFTGNWTDGWITRRFLFQSFHAETRTGANSKYIFIDSKRKKKQLTVRWESRARGNLFHYDIEPFVNYIFCSSTDTVFQLALLEFIDNFNRKAIQNWILLNMS